MGNHPDFVEHAFQGLRLLQAEEAAQNAFIEWANRNWWFWVIISILLFMILCGILMAFSMCCKCLKCLVAPLKLFKLCCCCCRVMPLNSWSFINVASWVLAPTSSISDSSKDASATPPPLQSDWLTLNPWFMPLILAVVLLLVLIALSASMYACCYKTSFEIKQEVRRLRHKELRELTVSEYESKGMQAVIDELKLQQEERKQKKKDLPAPRAE